MIKSCCRNLTWTPKNPSLDWTPKTQTSTYLLTVRLKWVCKYLFCVPHRIFSSGSFVPIFFSRERQFFLLATNCPPFVIMWVENVLSGTQLSNLLQLEPTWSWVNWVSLPIKIQYRFISYYFLRSSGTHRPSTIQNDPDHGEKWLPTTLNYTVTRRILTFLAVVIFIPWPLGSYRYLMYLPPSAWYWKKLASWSQTNSNLLTTIHLQLATV